MHNSQKVLDVAYELAEQDSRRGYLPYLRHVVIDSRPEPARFSAIARPWQWEFAGRYAPALEAVTGLRGNYSGPQGYWHTLARGHDKTTALARVANWVLSFGRRQITAVIAAADQDQAALLTDAMQVEAELNPWIDSKLKFMRDGVLGPGGFLEVITSDAPTAAGKRADLIICDEVTHWRNKALWDTLVSGWSKRQDAVLIVITNAGVKGSWQWDVKEEAKSIPRRWVVYEAPGRLPSWMSEQQVEDDRRLLTPSEARRLLDNIWIDPAEESGFLHRADIERCEALGRELGLTYCTQGKPGQEYWAGIDYGPKRDRTALSICHQTESGLVILDRLDVWQGSPHAPIQIAEVRSWLQESRQQFPDLHVVVDPHELEELVQDYERHIPIERYESRGGKGNYHLAESLRSLIVNQSLAWYPGAGSLPVEGQVEDFKQELLHLVTRQMPYGYRIDHEATKHDDRAVAVGMPCVCILRRPRATQFRKPPQVEKSPVQTVPIRIRTTAEQRGIYGMKSDRFGRF